MNKEEVKQAAGILALTRVRNQPIDQLPAEYRPADEIEAYLVQEQVHLLLDEAVSYTHLTLPTTPYV